MNFLTIHPPILGCADHFSQYLPTGSQSDHLPKDDSSNKVIGFKTTWIYLGHTLEPTLIAQDLCSGKQILRVLEFLLDTLPLEHAGCKCKTIPILEFCGQAESPSPIIQICLNGRLQLGIKG